MTRHTLILSNGRFLIEGKFELCTVKVVDGIIQEVAPSVSAKRSDRVLDLEGMAVVPGLINAHDHLEFNLFRKIGSPPYPNYVVWGDDLHRNHRDYIQQVIRVPLRLRLLWGAYKNVLSGVTTVVHHNEYYPHFRLSFPVDVHRQYSWLHSLALDRTLSKKLRRRSATPLIIHLAEGIDELARTELFRLHELGGLKPNTVIVHGISLSSSDIELIEQSGSSLIWCPSSNAFLFERTMPLERMHDKIRIALGTDSTLTGSRSLFDEIRFGIQMKNLRPDRMLDMVTSTPAEIFGMNKGSIAIGMRGDFLLFGSGECAPLETFLGLDASKIHCLVRGGIPLYGDPAVVEALQTSRNSYDAVVISGKRKVIRGNFTRLTRRIRQYLPSFEFNDLPIEFNHAD